MNDQEKSSQNINSLKEMFNSHKVIFKTYTDVRVPKQILKDMMKDLQEYYNQVSSNEGEQQSPALG